MNEFSQINLASKELVMYQPKLISKRCTKCGIHPAPSDMEKDWGLNWESKTMCLKCWESAEVWVIMVPKLKGITTDKIKEWYIPIKTREFARRRYIEAPPNTKVYISDGDRFWNWISIPYNLHNFVAFDTFVRVCPNWKVIKSDDEEQIYPDISNYVSC